MTRDTIPGDPHTFSVTITEPWAPGTGGVGESHSCLPVCWGTSGLGSQPYLLVTCLSFFSCQISFLFSCGLGCLPSLLLLFSTLW